MWSSTSPCVQLSIFWSTFFTKPQTSTILSRGMLRVQTQRLIDRHALGEHFFLSKQALGEFVVFFILSKHSSPDGRLMMPTDCEESELRR